MQYTKLGTSDLNVSRICLGCMSFGNGTGQQKDWALNYEKSEEIIKYALDNGINFFDTANCYSDGSSEEFLGKALNKFVKRDEVIIATKVYFNEGKLSKEAIHREVNKSLERLHTNYIDLLIIHRFDYSTPIGETMEALNEVIKEGKVRYIGASAMYAYQLQKMQDYAEYRNLHKFISMQNHYNLIYREEEREMGPFCKEENIALTPYSALAAGRLSKHPGETSARLEKDVYAKGKYDATADEDMKIIRRVEEIAAKHNVSMTEVSLAWLLGKVTAPVVGATKLHHIEGAAKAVDLTLSPEEITYLEEKYVPHRLVGVMAQNTPAAAKEKHVWSTGSQQIEKA